MRGLGPALLFAPLALLLLQGQSYELQDTIHALMEENIQLHDQLESLNRALRELGGMLRHRPNDPDRHDEDVRHLRDEWSRRGIDAEALLLLERAFCGRDLHSSASPFHRDASSLPLTLPCLATLLIICRLWA